MADEQQVESDRYPRPLAFRVIDGRAASLTTLVSGTKALLFESPTNARLLAVAEALQSLASSTRRSTAESSPDTRRTLEKLSGVPADVVDAWPDVKKMFELACSWRAGRERSVVLTHGDCTMANLLFAGERAALIDWSNASYEGVEHFDALWLSWHLFTKRFGHDAASTARRLLDPDPNGAVEQCLLREYASATRESRMVVLSALLAVLAARYARERRADRVADLSVAATSLMRPPAVVA
jgi:aminoglycoside phosphotransferase (APT) family kinase protein